MRSILGMLPGIGKQVRDAEIDERQLDRVQAIILSMTPKERREPAVIDGSRRKRIAAGSGTSVQQVNQVLQQYRQMRKMMKQFASGGVLSCRVPPCPPRPWRSWSCLPGSRATPRPCSTSSPPPARWSGPARARCPARTAGSPSTSPTPRLCCSLPRTHWKSPLCTSPSWPPSPAGTGCSSGRSPTRSGPPPTRTHRPPTGDALWELAWSGRLTNDTLAPLRALLGSGRTAGSTAHRAKRGTPRPLRLVHGRGPARLTHRPAHGRGRWSLLPPRGAGPDDRRTPCATRCWTGTAW